MNPKWNSMIQHGLANRPCFNILSVEYHQMTLVDFRIVDICNQISLAFR